MKYIINRSTDYGIKPCDKAFMSMHDRWETRTCKTEEEFNIRFESTEGSWRSKGFSHQETNNGHIKRQLANQKLWTIEINSIDDLVELVNNYGEIIIRKHTWSSTSPEIEIVDDNNWKEE